MRVEVSGKQFVFPRRCACCEAYATRHVEVEGSEKNRQARTKGWAWDIPYCQGCQRHVQRFEKLQVIILATTSLGIALGFVAGLFGGWQRGLTVAGLGVVTTITFYLTIRRWLQMNLSQNCWGLPRALLYLGSNRDCHAFDIKSSYYAEAFILDNRRKIVNASPMVAGILRNTDFGDYQVPRRVLRRKR